VHGDPARLLQIVDNLLSNACKYTPAGGRIEVVTSHTGERCEVRVTDTGVGLTPEMIPQMFSLFGQVHRSLSATRGGLGIGLTVVRRLVELHDGTIDVHSPGLGAGSTFVVGLPLASPPAGARPGAAPGDAAASAATRLGVLVVDDNVDAAEMLASVLELSGFEVRTAHDANGALAQCAAWRPDAAVLDIGLPGLSGNELARRLRQKPWGRELVLVAVTGWGQDDDRSRTAEAGFDLHLVKPVDPQYVREVIDRFASQRAPGMPPPSA
jgi:CheY-like chemotaxis protein